MADSPHSDDKFVYLYPTPRTLSILLPYSVVKTFDTYISYETILKFASIILYLYIQYFLCIISLAGYF